MRHEITAPHFLETPQQDLRDIIPGDGHEFNYALDRSCTPHCAEAIAELYGLYIPSFERIDLYAQFLLENGAHSQSGTSNPEMYSVNDGWYNIAVADLLRLNDFSVVQQRLQYGSQETQIDLAEKSGRVRNLAEKDTLNHLKQFGGERSDSWCAALGYTVSEGGYPIVSIKIPSSKVVGAIGQHSVVVLEVREEDVVYYDPDKLVLDRYGERAEEQGIIRVDDSRLIYSQAKSRFLERMSGEVMHVFRR